MYLKTTHITHVTQRNSCIIPITQVGHVELHSIWRRPPFCSLMTCSALPPRASKLVSLTKSNWLGHPPRFVPPNMQPTHNYPSICSLNCIGVILKGGYQIDSYPTRLDQDKKTKRQKDKKTKRQNDKMTKWQKTKRQSRSRLLITSHQKSERQWQRQSYRLVTFETLITILTIENLVKLDLKVR